jgi:hypothetical protein
MPMLFAWCHLADASVPFVNLSARKPDSVIVVRCWHMLYVDVSKPNLHLASQSWEALLHKCHELSTVALPVIF